MKISSQTIEFRVIVCETTESRDLSVRLHNFDLLCVQGGNIQLQYFFANELIRALLHGLLIAERKSEYRPVHNAQGLLSLT